MNLYLHVGENTVIFLKKIIAVLNMEKISKYNNDFFETANYNNKLVMLCEKDEVKTCIITDEKIYMTSISSYTITKRIENFKINYMSKPQYNLRF